MSMDGPPASGSYPQPTTPSLVGQVLDNKYRVIKLLGEGGMGEVYAAQHLHIDKGVAVKVLKAEIVSNAEAVKRFQQEAAASSSIKHQNIIGIDDFGQLPDGRFYMYMELLDGTPLDQLIQQPVSADRLLNILIQSCHGLAAAHAKGIIHRDMKPENIFVTRGPNGQDVPKLLDFGIAKVSGNDGQNHLTRTGTIFGTPFYMAPEQALGNPVDARTDIYAMGVIMYECFAGSLPFQGDSFMGILTQHITTEPEPVAQRAAKAGRQLPMGMAEIITRCMQKNPAQRYGTMDELCNALIGVYRGIAGAGMSTYMEAFPSGNAQHLAQPTPPPMMSGGHLTPAAGAAVSGGYGPQGAATPGSGMYAASASSSVIAPKKSKLGLIIAIVAVLVVGGGITAFVLLQQGSGSGGPGSGSGSGSSSGVASGSQAVVTGSGGSGSGTGSAIAVNAGSGSAVKPDVGVGSGSSAGSEAGGNVQHDEGSGSAIATIEPKVVVVKTSPAYAIGAAWVDGKVADSSLPAEIKVIPGQPVEVTIKASGFKDGKITVDGSKDKVTVKLVRIAQPHHPGNPTSGGTTPPPGHPNCSATIVDAKDKHCVNQYCMAHPDDMRCEAE